MWMIKVTKWFVVPGFQLNAFVWIKVLFLQKQRHFILQLITKHVQARNVRIEKDHCPNKRAPHQCAALAMHALLCRDSSAMIRSSRQHAYR